MIRSFYYAAYSNLLGDGQSAAAHQIANADDWAEAWYRCISATFMRSYLESLSETSIFPKDREKLEILFNAYLLDKALYELNYEMNNRPIWVILPLRGIAAILGSAPQATQAVGAQDQK
jgi:maltose alpha-D-glucosyltransferase/alpha-amylase